SSPRSVAAAGSAAVVGFGFGFAWDFSDVSERLHGAHKRAHEFSINLRCHSVYIDAFSGEELAGIADSQICDAVNAGRFDVDFLETGRGQLLPIFIFGQRSGHAAYPEQYTLANFGKDLAARDHVRDGKP